MIERICEFDSGCMKPCEKLARFYEKGLWLCAEHYDLLCAHLSGGP